MFKYSGAKINNSILPKLFNKFLPKSLASNNVTKAVCNVSKPINNDFSAHSPSDMQVALSVVSIYESIFNKIPLSVISNIDNIKNHILMYKTFTFMKTDPSLNVLLHKKFISSLIPKPFIVMKKLEALEFMKKVSINYPNLKYNLYIDENTSYVVIYEMFSAFEFGLQQSSVQSITFLPENASRSLISQEESKRLTKQTNCDLEVTYKSPNEKPTRTLLDILIGRNKEYKGNLSFRDPKDIANLEEHKNHYIAELNRLLSNFDDKSSNEYIVTFQKIEKITEIWNSNMTAAARILNIQEEIISFLPFWRQYNASANPNMIVFMPQNSVSEDQYNMAKEIQSFVEPLVPFHNGIPSTTIEKVISATLTIYLNKKNIDITTMPEQQRLLCLGIMKKYAPTKYIEIFESIIQ